MARSHKDRYKWKRKERKRTGKGDPAKIKLHRNRFLELLERQAATVLAPDQTGPYVPIVFHARLRFDPESQETEIVIPGHDIHLPFLVEDPKDCYGAITRIKDDFTPSLEEEVLKKHVDRMKHTGKVCHLEVLMDKVRLCSSVIPCKYRKWDSEAGEAVCTMPR